MHTYTFANILLQMLLLVPVAAVSMFPPLKHASEYWKRLTIYVLIAAALAFISAILATVSKTASLGIYHALSIIILAVIYPKFSKIPPVKSISIFLWAVTLMSYPYSLSFTLNVFMNPGSTSLMLNDQTVIIRLLIGTVIAGIFYVTIEQKEEILVDSEYLTSSHWLITIPVSAIFLFLNILMIPANIATIKNAAVLNVYLSYIFFSLSLYVLMFIIFRMFSLEFIENAKAREQQHFLAVQESEYLNLQQSIEQMRRFRHDIRHSFAILQDMADRKDIDGIQKYLKEYQQVVPNMKNQNYTPNHTVNAVLNHYNSLAENKKVHPVLQINLPAKLSIPDTVLCSMIGNLFENAIEGCETVPEELRQLSLSVIVKSDTSLYIVTTNTFDGKAKTFHGRYLSTKRTNGGVGTTSITTLTEKFGGSVQFHHDTSHFYVDIVIPVTVPKDSGSSDDYDDDDDTELMHADQ